MINDNEVTILEKFKTSFKPLKKASGDLETIHCTSIHDEVISLKDGVFILISSETEILIIDIHKNIILFEIDFSKYHKLHLNEINLSNNKEYIYVSFSKIIYSINTINYEINLLYQGDNWYTMHKMNNNNNLALFYECELEKTSTYLDIFDIKSKKVVNTICIEKGPDLSDPLIFTKDDRYLIIRVIHEFLVYDLKYKKVAYLETINEDYQLDSIDTKYIFSRDDKYLIATFSYIELGKKSKFGLAKVIDFKSKKLLYILDEKPRTPCFDPEKVYNITISNDENYVFVDTSFSHTLGFEISTGKALDIPSEYANERQFFFDSNYPNHVGMLSEKEYILAEIKYKDLY